METVFLPEHLETYLGIVSRFPYFTALNHLLIYLQKPDATALAGASKWKRDGFSFLEKTRPVYILRPAFTVEDPGEPRRSEDGRILTDLNKAVLYEREPVYGYKEEVKIVIDVSDTTGYVSPQTCDVSDLSGKIRRCGITVVVEPDRLIPLETPDGYCEDTVFHVPERLCRERIREQKALLTLLVSHTVLSIGKEELPSEDHLEFLCLLTRTVAEKILFRESCTNVKLLSAKAATLSFEEKKKILALVSAFTEEILTILTGARLTFFDTALVNHLFGTGNKMELNGMLQKVMRDVEDPEARQAVFSLADRIAGAEETVTGTLYLKKLNHRGIDSFPPYLLEE